MHWHLILSSVFSRLLKCEQFTGYTLVSMLPNLCILLMLVYMMAQKSELVCIYLVFRLYY